MKEITIKAPEGFEFDSPNLVTIEHGDWFLCVSLDGEITAEFYEGEAGEAKH